MYIVQDLMIYLNEWCHSNHINPVFLRFRFNNNFAVNFMHSLEFKFGAVKFKYNEFIVCIAYHESAQMLLFFMQRLNTGALVSGI